MDIEFTTAAEPFSDDFFNAVMSGPGLSVTATPEPDRRSLALDVCCGGRMFYYDRHDPRVIFCDIRDMETTLCDGRTFRIHPDLVADFRDIPFGDGEFPLVIFDPPHLRKAGERSWLVQKYGRLPAEGWKEYLAAGFKECWRVLSHGGTLIFKWSEDQIKVSQIQDIFPDKPLLGSRAREGRSIFIVFFKK